MKLLRLTESDSWSTKTIKSAFKIYLSNTCNQLQDPRLHLFSYLSSCHLSSLYFSEACPQWVSLPYHPSVFDHTLFCRWCCFQISSKHFIQIGLSTPKIISLYIVMVFLMAFSSSSFVIIQFGWGIFFCFF